MGTSRNATTVTAAVLLRRRRPCVVVAARTTVTRVCFAEDVVAVYRKGKNESIRVPCTTSMTQHRAIPENEGGGRL